MPEPSFNDLTIRFVAMARMFQKEHLLLPDLFPEADRQMILELLRAAGFPAHSLKPSKEKRNYGNDNVGDDIRVINPNCPFAVCWFDDDFRIREECRVRVHDDATIWLDEQLAAAWKNPEQKGVADLMADLAKAIADSIPLAPIVMTAYGDAIVEYRDSREHRRDGDLFRTYAGRHAMCGGGLEVKPCSKEWRTLVCTSCRLRVYIPSSLATYGDLRRFFAETVAMRR